MQNTKQQFIEFALEADVLRFGEFKTKAGRLSPYFFNAGLFNTGARLDRLGAFYAETLLAARKAGRLDFDMIFGPAYKGIPLAASVAMNLSRMGCDVPWTFNRKEIKDHGEGGMIVGAPLKGRVVIIDDVISAGTSVRESVKIIEANNASPLRRPYCCRSYGTRRHGRCPNGHFSRSRCRENIWSFRRLHHQSP